MAFYLPFSRIWELAVGSILAHHTLTYGECRSQTVGQVFAALGSVLIAVSLLLLGQGNAFPGWWALLPTLGTALLIRAGPQAWINRAVLGDPACVMVGLFSYPLYLWHWPILAYLKLIADSDLSFSALNHMFLMAGMHPNGYPLDSPTQIKCLVRGIRG